MPEDLHIHKNGERCRYLLSKGLYLNAGLPPGEEVTGDGYFWCGRNQSQRGPDNHVCDLDVCCNAARRCYEAR